MKKQKLRVRHSVRELQTEYDNNNKKPLEDLMRAWKGIKDLPPTDMKSFFNLGGYHGEPFIQAGAIDNQWWGGYCNHGNVLFPTWHRAYVLKLEEALQSIVPDVMMPYWDETSTESLKKGIPKCLTQNKFRLDGKWIDNPLKSYIFQVEVRDDAKGDDNNYFKPITYETVRYPLSGLVGSVSAFSESAEHNAKYPSYKKNVKLLNKNVKAWLTGSQPVEEIGKKERTVSIYNLFKNCLSAPNYTVFSNTVSQTAHNLKNPKNKVVALEAPHNDIHLAVGGFDFPGTEFGIISGSNGDMGENNTAAMDPIFFFHHCNVDRMFWLWQKHNGHTNSFDIDVNDPGANSNTLKGGGQGPTPNFGDNVTLTMDSPLVPFMINEESNQKIYTSRDVINIEKQLGFTYSPGSFDKKKEISKSKKVAKHTKALVVTGLNKERFAGSLIISAYATIKGKKTYLGHESVLSRWSVANCANCQSRLDLTAHFDLGMLSEKEIKNADFSIKISHRGKELPDRLDYKLKVIG